MNIDFDSVDSLPHEKSRMENIADRIKDGFRKIGTFIYETPVTIIALAVIGIALLIFFPKFALPFLGAAGAHTLARLMVKIIDLFHSERFTNLKEKIYDFDQKYSKVVYIAFIIAVVICLIAPIAGLVIAVGLGIYKGMIAEIDIYKYKQEVEREKLDTHAPEPFVTIVCL